MKRVFNISLYPGFVVFILAGISVVMVAFLSFNLFDLAMANLRFFREQGWVAAEVGGLVQLAQIVFYGAIALFFFILFKICESDLVRRYNRWKDS